MRYFILGPLEVRDGANVVPLAQGRQRVLLAILLLRSNEAITRERLIDALWGESPPPTAASSLHNLVSGLRKTLGDGTVVTQGAGYLVRVADGDLDAQRFEDLAQRGRAASARGDVEDAATLLHEALALWRGPALADLAYEAALQSEASRLEDRRLATLKDRIDADLGCGRAADLTAELETLVSQHPLRERLRAQQMLALYRAGRQADALQVYGDARRTLVDELGIEPGPELRRLERAVLDQDPALDGPSARRAPRLQSPTIARARRHPRALMAGGGLLIAAAVAVFVATGGSGSDTARLPPVAGDSLAGIDPGSNRIIATIPLGATPTSVSADADAVWALSADDQTIARVDARTKSVHVFGVGAVPTDLATGAGALWVGSGTTGPQEVGVSNSRLLRVDPDTQTVRAQIDLPAPRSQGPDSGPGQIVVHRGSVWTLNGGGQLSRVDARSGRVTATVKGLRARAIASDGPFIWAIATEGATVVQVNARTATVRRRVALQASRLDAIAAAGGTAWVADASDGTLWRVDAGPTVISRTVDVGSGVDAVAVDGNAVWVTNSLRGTLVRVDPRRNAVAATVAVGNTPRDVAVGAGAVWVTLSGPGAAVPAAVTAASGGPTALPARGCGRVLTGTGSPPDYLIASDFPLQSAPLGTQPAANAVAFVLRQHRFRAGRYRLGYQSCDASTASSGVSDERKCSANARAYAANPAVLGVVGPFNSSCAMAEIPIASRAPGGPMAMISPANSQIALTKPDPAEPRGTLRRLYPNGVRNYARVYPPDDAQAAADALLARQLGLRRVYVLNTGEPYGQGMARHFRSTARTIGLGLAGSAGWDLGGSGFPALVERVARARPDGVFLAGFAGANGGPLTRALRARLGSGFPLIAPDAFGPVDFLFDESRGAASGMYISLPGLPNERLGSRGRRFVREFGATQASIPVSGTAVYSAAATEALLAAIARSDGSRASVSRAPLSTRLDDSIIGPLRFDHNGDLVAPAVTILRVRRRDGVSDVEHFEGAAVDRVIAPPATAIR
ncbi:MAG TPA: BTAD domain-containing putative transcriptional regulator [Solirubrobacteraceae bacterium]|nr:BTAD domain-containing putative transcriptional regulator [Solirubrobacteraceae bacterium]